MFTISRGDLKNLSLRDQIVRGKNSFFEGSAYMCVMLPVVPQIDMGTHVSILLLETYKLESGRMWLGNIEEIKVESC